MIVSICLIQQGKMIVCKRFFAFRLMLSYNKRDIRNGGVGYIMDRKVIW